MDPTANFFEQIRLAQRIVTDDTYRREPDRDTCVALAERVLDLAQWIGSGGFLPAQFARAPRTDGSEVPDAPLSFKLTPIEEETHRHIERLIDERTR